MWIIVASVYLFKYNLQNDKLCLSPTAVKFKFQLSWSEEKDPVEIITSFLNPASCCLEIPDVYCTSWPAAMPKGDRMPAVDGFT